MLSKRGLTLKHKQLSWKAPEGLFQDRGDVSSVFNIIYEKSIWGKGSGGGSNFRNARPYCEYLQKFLTDYEIKSVIDYGCGDWRISEHINWGNIRYLGIDVVSSLIEHNTREHGKENIKFMFANILDPGVFLPPADLFILKDVLMHLSNENVIKILSIAAQYPYVLITDDYSNKNVDCQNGDTRPLDVRREPFYIKQAKVVLAYDYKKSFLIQS
jgi:SAM-dependent methyltransferase